MEDQKNQKEPIPFKKTSRWKKLLGKKWAFPAIYIGAAAIILALVVWYQGNVISTVSELSTSTEEVTETAVPNETDQEAAPVEEDAVPAAGSAEPMGWPVGDGVQYEQGMGFYNEQASAEEQQKALVKYNNSYFPHTGIDLKAADGNSFDVVAVLEGKVTKVENDPLVGKFVEVEHADKLVSVYQGLEEVTVKPGDEVTKGQILGSAGRNEYEKDAGVHLHFEIHVDGKPVDPAEYLREE